VERARASGEEWFVEGDSEVVRASLEDAERFETIFDRYHILIWGYLARLGGRAHADELAAEVFLVAFRKRATFDPARGDVRGWLYGIASNISRTRLRSEARRRRAFAKAAGERVDSVSPVEATTDALAQRTRLRLVLEALGRLSSRDREVIVLFAWEELSYEQIADALGIEVGTVRSRLSRARTRLRELVALVGEENDELVENDHG
jgi:RNA polymerase sigma-70 factor (ECF subfamily)